VKPTECPGFAPVGCTHPTAVEPAFPNSLEPDTCAAREADESRAARPCEVVAPDDRPPTGSEPIAAEPVDDRNARTVTNEASGPAATVTNEASGPAVSRGPASVGQGPPEPALGPIDGPPGPEADGPAASRPTDAGPDDGAPIAANEAISEKGEVERAGADSVSREPPRVPLAVGVDRSGPSREDERDARSEGLIGCSLSTVTAGACAPSIVIAGACAPVLGEHPTNNLRGFSQTTTKVCSATRFEPPKRAAWQESG
jgi:hypothetical protein